ncbi:MAG: tRNA epoxyqueuosine(34) reductase QueG [Terriglobales bacterium]
MTGAAQFVEHVTQQAMLAGFDLCGVTRVWPAQFTELRHFPQWIAEGRAGEMAYLAARTEAGELKRSSLDHVAPWAKSVIVCGLNYNADAPRSIDPHPPGAGWISRYAWFGNSPDASAPGKGVDYHDAVLRRLRQVEAAAKQQHGDTLRTWSYVDTGPLVERVYAKYAGLGWMAKNTCIINEELGSFFFLGVILTSFDFPQGVALPALAADRCGSCTLCIDACPTQAITPYQLDASRCISYFTIEKRGDIPEEFRAPIGRHVFGCDICQDVCPWNRGTGADNAARQVPTTAAPEFQPKPELVNPALDWLAEMSREDFNRVFKDSPIKRAKYAGMRRNVAIAMGNSGEERYRARLEKLAADDGPILAEHARWALQRLTKVKQELQQK